MVLPGVDKAKLQPDDVLSASVERVLAMTPFILKGCKKLADETEPSSDQRYDRYNQLWINQSSGTPVVVELQRLVQASKFGETTITETREGADQSEISSYEASQFGETTITRAEGEGADEPMIADVLSSQFGETTHTASPEGIDEPRLSDLLSSQFGETTMTKTQEGTDQSEIALVDYLTVQVRAEL
jgi:hypothetical protein